MMQALVCRSLAGLEGTKLVTLDWGFAGSGWVVGE